LKETLKEKSISLFPGRNPSSLRAAPLRGWQQMSDAVDRSPAMHIAEEAGPRPFEPGRFNRSAPSPPLAAVGD